MTKTIKKYLTVWKALALTEFQNAFIHRGTHSLFLLGKFMRLGMALTLLFVIKNTVKQFAGYTSDQMVVFYLTYQFVDVLGQTFYRGVYMFSEKVRSGEFDFTLLKPMSSLFQALVGKPDVNDALFILPITGLSLYIFSTLNLAYSLSTILWYLALLLNSFLIVTALHIVVLVVGVVTTEVDGVIWMYRDLSALGRFPITIYGEPLKTLLFFVVPIGMMITIPAELLLGSSPTFSLGLTFAVGLASLFVSLKLWNWSLRKYSSASS